jgi:hypothetical protein
MQIEQSFNPKYSLLSFLLYRKRVDTNRKVPIRRGLLKKNHLFFDIKNIVFFQKKLSYQIWSKYSTSGTALFHNVLKRCLST